jgi:hypothetical protein
MFFPIVGKGFVECDVLIFGDIISFSHPERFSFVKFLELVRNFLDLLLFLFRFFVLFFFVLVN